MAIVIMAALFSLQTVRAASRATLKVRSTDRAVAFGYDMLEKARAFGCGTEVYSESAISARSVGCGGLGVSTFTETDDVGQVFTARIFTRWALPDAAPVAGCGHLLGPGTPMTLTRTVEVTYPYGDTTQRRTLRTIEAVPPDAISYNSQVRGGAVVRVTPQALVQMANPAGVVITRQADSVGCVWFPYIPVGAASPRFTGGTCVGQTVVIVARVNKLVNC